MPPPTDGPSVALGLTPELLMVRSACDILGCFYVYPFGPIARTRTTNLHSRLLVTVKDESVG